MAYTKSEREAAAKASEVLYEAQDAHKPECLCAICACWATLFSVGFNKSPARTARLFNMDREAKR